MIVLDGYLNYLSLASGLGLYDYIHFYGFNIMKAKTRKHKFATRRIVSFFGFILLVILVTS